MIIRCDWLFKYVLKGYAGITLIPFIIVKVDADDKTVYHERVHLAQQARAFIVWFYVRYVAEYLWLLAIHGDGDKAYKNISYEVEARKLTKDHYV